MIRIINKKKRNKKLKNVNFVLWKRQKFDKNCNKKFRQNKFHDIFFSNSDSSDSNSRNIGSSSSDSSNCDIF